MKLYKILNELGHSCNGGECQWSLPVQNEDGTWIPGEWMPEIRGELEPCMNGYHICNVDQLVEWLNARIFEVEVEGEIIHEDSKSVCRKCRLVKELTTWNERVARHFACDCAERVLPVYEAEFPDDRIPRKTIETARRYADGQATREELDAAWDAARATWEAAWDAARAAWEAAGEAAGEAAWAAAGEAAWAAAGEAVGEAAWTAEREWQVAHLKELLGVGE